MHSIEITDIIKELKSKIIGFAKSVDPDDAVHHEPPHLGLHCLPSSL